MSDMLQQENVHDPTETLTLRRMRWFLLSIILFWLLAAMVVTALVICLTKNLFSLSLFSTFLPPAYLLHWIAKRLFPMDEKTFELKKLSIQMKAWNNKDLQRSSNG